MAVAGSVAEQVMLLENIGTSLLVSKDQVSSVYHLLPVENLSLGKAKKKSLCNNFVLFLFYQLSGLHRLMVEAAEILNIDAPDLYVRQSPVPNAYTLAISGKKPFVVVHTSLVELLTREELQVINFLFDVNCSPRILYFHPYFLSVLSQGFLLMFLYFRSWL